jgi:hypothetical protein
VDPAAAMSAVPGATPLADPPDAWHWSLAPGFDFAAALSKDRGHLFQSYALDSYDEDLARAVLSFARAHPEELIAPPERPLVALDGFSHPGKGFDILVAIGPTVHEYQSEDPALHEVTRAVFPAYRCEFAGDEDETQTRFRYTRAAGVPATRWDREPHPFITMRHKTETGRVIAKRGFAQLATLVNELRTLEGRPDRFVEFENYRHDVWRVEWDGLWVVTGESAPQRLEFDELLEFVRADLYGPNLTSAT